MNHKLFPDSSYYRLSNNSIHPFVAVFHTQFYQIANLHALLDSTLHTKTYMPTTARAAIRINSTKNTGQSFLFMIQLSEH